jgi:hypothetical protein
MKEITPKGIRRGRGGRAISWSKILQRYQGEPMFKLVSAIVASPVSGELFAMTSMSRLLITDSEQFYFDDNVLSVSYDAEAQEFEFEHRTLAAKNDKKRTGEADALQTLILFLKYKFGVLLDSKTADKTAG